jgi:hypothetical protein
MRAKLLVLIALALALGAALLACNGLLGNQDAVADDAGDEGSGLADGEVDRTTGDAMHPNDARVDGAGMDGGGMDGAMDRGIDGAPPDAPLDVSIPADAPYTAIAFDTSGPTAVAVDTNDVYWIDGTSVQGCAKTGCSGSPTQYATGVALTAVAAAPSGFLYWADSAGAGSVAFCTLPACASPSTMGPFMAPERIALSPMSAFWTVQQGGTIDSCALGATCSPPSTFTASQPYGIAWGALDGGTVYYTGGGGLSFCATAMCPLGGSFQSFSGGPYDVAADPSGLPVCVTVQGTPSGEVDCIFSLGTTALPQTMAKSPSPLYVALDTTYVYWVDDTDLALERCPLNAPCASNPEVIARFPGQPGTFVLDGTNIYGAVTGGTGFVYRMTKP